MLKFPQQMKNRSLQYRVEKSRQRKKTTTIKVTPTGEVVVQVPQTMEKTEIRKIVQKKKDWIRKKIEKAQNTPTPTNKKFVSGEKFSYLGKSYPLKIIEMENREPAVLKLYQGKFYAEISKGLPIREREQKLRVLFINWYIRHGQAKAKEKATYFALKLNTDFENVKFKKVTSLWGSCTPKRNLTFNWKIVMAPHPVFHYIIIHEVCHLKHHGHGKNYWRLVQSLDPDWKKHRQWLKNNSWKLSI